MQNPYIHFPYVTKTTEGNLVFSGVMPEDDGTFTVIAFCPAADGLKRRTVGYLNYPTLEQADNVARQHGWFEGLAAA